MSKHEWILEVFQDLADYAEKNGLTDLLAQIEATLPILEDELGNSQRLVTLRTHFEKTMVQAQR